MKCIQSAKKYREQPLCFWDQVLWTVESKFNLFGPDGRVMVWRTPQEAFDPRCTVPTVKHGGENVVLGLYLIIRCRKSCLYRREHDTRGLSWYFTKKFIRICKEIEFGTELGLATWEWPEIQSPYSNEMVGWKRSWTAKMAIVLSGLKSDPTYLGRGWKVDEKRKVKMNLN